MYLTQVLNDPTGTLCSDLQAMLQALHPMQLRLSITKPYFIRCSGRTTRGLSCFAGWRSAIEDLMRYLGQRCQPQCIQQPVGCLTPGVAKRVFDGPGGRRSITRNSALTSPALIHVTGRLLFVAPRPQNYQITIHASGINSTYTGPTIDHVALQLEPQHLTVVSFLLYIPR